MKELVGALAVPLGRLLRTTLSVLSRRIEGWK
jgi:hypothetical protein